MKKIALVIATVVLVVLLSTCNLLGGTSINDRISQFMKDINMSDRSAVYLNLDSASSQYNADKTAAYWNIVFQVFDIPTFALSSQYTYGNTVTATLSSSNQYNNAPISFVMTKDSGGNYVINSITLNSSQIYY